MSDEQPPRDIGTSQDAESTSAAENGAPSETQQEDATNAVGTAGSADGTADTTSASNGVTTVQPTTGEEGEEQVDDDDEDVEYQKTLRSDVTAELSHSLLQQIAAKDPAYKEFHPNDLKKLSKVLSVLSVSKGDTIIQRGEEATFCGIVLDGCFQAIVSPTISVDLRRGALVGEMALYEGGLRNADIRCSEDAVLAVITFQELSELGTTFPILQRHLYFLFAVASIKKLRKMALTPQQIQEMQKKDEEDAARAQNEAPKEKPKEFLYRQRMEQQSSTLPTSPTNAQSSAEKSAAAFSAALESAAEVEKEKSKRAKLEKQQKSDRIKLDNALRKVEKFTALVEQRDAELQTASYEIGKKDSKINSLEKARDELNNTLSKLQSQLDAAVSQKDKAELKLSTVMDVSAKENEMKYEPLLNSARNEFNRVRAELETNHQHLKKTTEEHLKLLDLNKKMQDTVAQITSVRNTLYTELFDEKKRREGLEGMLQEREKLVLELKFNLRHLEVKCAEAEEKNITLLPWKVKCLEITHALEVEKKQCARAIEDALRGKIDLEEDIQRYQKLLKFVVIGTFCRESRLRRSLAITHEHVSDMLLTSMEENVASGSSSSNSGTASSNAMTVQGSNPSSNSPSAANQFNKSNKTPSSNFRAIKKKKRAYLQTLLKSKSKPREIVASLDEEVLKLRAPMEEILEKIRHWRLTSESFFQRTVELTTEKEELESSFRKTLQKVESIKQLLRNNQQEHEDLVNRNSELSKMNHALKIEVERLQAKYGVLATNAAGVSSSTPGGGEKGSEKGGSEKSPSPSSSSITNEEKGGDSSGHETKKSKDHAPGKRSHRSSATGPLSSSSAAASSKTSDAISALQLKQQDLLQQNILRLQAHYEYLLAQVQGLNPSVGVGPDGTLSQSLSTTSLVGGSQQQHQSTTSISPPGPSASASAPLNGDEKQTEAYQSLDVWAGQGGLQSGANTAHNSTANLHGTSTQGSYGSPLNATYTIGVPPRAQGVSSNRSNHVPYPSGLRPVHTMHPVAPSGMSAAYYTQTQPVPHSLSPASQRAYQDHHRQLYNQAVGKKYHGAGGASNRSSRKSLTAEDQHTIKRIESQHLFHLPQMTQQPGPPPQQAQTQRSSATSASNILLTYKAGAMTSRATR